jgi:uncharacterized protein (DUF2141 family)
MKTATHLFCVRLVAAASLFIFVAASASAQSDYTVIKVDDGGAITGTVKWSGPTPKAPKLSITKDASVCDPESHKVRDLERLEIGSDGGVANTVVFLKDITKGKAMDLPEAREHMDQKNCRYHRHVMGLMVGQPLQILNSDPTLHNIHATPASNQEFNTGQPIQGMKTNHTFTAKEVMVPFKCDVHGWMNAYAGVLDHPFFAVTGEDGTYSIKGLPPGTYTIAAWQEKMGSQTQSVTVAAKETKDANLTFKPAATGN